MPHANLTAAVLFAASLFAVGEESTAIEPRTLIHSEAQTYATADARVRGSFEVSSAGAGERLHAVTVLPSGGTLTELALTDATGKLVRAELTFDANRRGQRVHMVLDPREGTVALRSPTLNASWTVPNDAPWVWAPLRDPRSARSFATPLEAQVALRGAAGGRPVRLLDLAKLESFSMMADQIVFPDAEPGSATVVLGDDYADIVDGHPARVHLSALNGDLVSVQHAVSPAAAASDRAHPAESTTL